MEKNQEKIIVPNYDLENILGNLEDENARKIFLQKILFNDPKISLEQTDYVLALNSFLDCETPLISTCFEIFSNLDEKNKKDFSEKILSLVKSGIYFDKETYGFEDNIKTALHILDFFNEQEKLDDIIPKLIYKDDYYFVNSAFEFLIEKKQIEKAINSLIVKKDLNEIKKWHRKLVLDYPEQGKEFLENFFVFLKNKIENKKIDPSSEFVASVIDLLKSKDSYDFGIQLLEANTDFSYNNETCLELLIFLNRLKGDSQKAEEMELKLEQTILKKHEKLNNNWDLAIFYENKKNYAKAIHYYEKLLFRISHSFKKIISLCRKQGDEKKLKELQEGMIKESIDSISGSFYGRGEFTREKAELYKAANDFDYLLNLMKSKSGFFDSEEFISAYTQKIDLFSKIKDYETSDKTCKELIDYCLENKKYETALATCDKIKDSEFADKKRIQIRDICAKQKKYDLAAKISKELNDTENEKKYRLLAETKDKLEKLENQK
jgi:hypothetical protein